MPHEIEYKEVKKILNESNQCTKCGMCAQVCPVYQEELVEYSSPRGKNILIRNLLAGKLKFTNKFVDRLNKCTLCMTCTQNCPAKVQTSKIIVSARADKVETTGMSFLFSLICRWILPNRLLFGKFVRTFY